MKNIKLIILSTLIIFIAACEKEDLIKTNDLGTEFFISGSYTTLDGMAIISVENQQKNLSSIQVTALGGVAADDDETEIPAPVENLGAISVSDGAGAMTIMDNDLGLDGQPVGSTMDYELSSSYSGKSITRYFTLSLDNPISVDVPMVTHRSDTTFTFEYAVEPANATVTTVTLQSKVGELGTYSPISGDWGAEGSFQIKGSDYNVDDTLFVKVMASSDAGKTVSEETAVPINTVMVEGLESFTLNMNDKMAYDLINMENVESTSANADMVFTGEYQPGTNPKVGFMSNNAEFVMGTSTDYANADVVTISNMDFTGAVMMDDDVMEGDVYFFRTKHGSGDWFYGIMKVTMVDKPQGVLEDSYIEIEFKY